MLCSTTHARKQRLGSARHSFASKTAKPKLRDQRREAELDLLKHVIARNTAENLEPKNGPSD
jgi:hypothetical protein